MKTLVFPIAIWKDADGCFTARTLDGLSAAATDTTAAAALKQLKKHLVKQQRQQDVVFEEPEMRALEFVEFVAQVRPQYKSGRAVHPCRQPVKIHVPAVIGRRGDRSVVCTAPTIDMQLVSLDVASVKQLMQESVRESLGGMTPRQLGQHYAPVKLELETLNVRTQPPPENVGLAALDSLPAVADSLVDRGVRRRMGRALQIDESTEALAQRIMGRQLQSRFDRRKRRWQINAIGSGCPQG